MKLMIQSSKLIFLFAVVMAAMSFVSAVPSLAGWEMLGQRKVNYAGDRDEILVTRAEGVFSAIKLHVKKAPINMHKLVVHFGNGETQEFELRNNFSAGSESRVIDLPGNKRVIKKVVFWYDTKNIAARKGIVELWGRH
jgi:hypothetical protein